jgi:enterochelin esterase-like enzyme
MTFPLMKPSLLLTVLLAITSLAFAADPLPGVPAGTNVPGADYPRLLPDNRVVFRVKAPQAQSVKFQTGKAYPAERDAEGNWTATTDPQVPGFHYYWLIIDDVRVNDPASETFYGTGKQTSGIEVPEPGHDGDYYGVQNVPHGEIRERRYHSRVTDAWRRFFLYTPPGYDQDRDTRYPVLYLQHGAGEDERAWGVQGRVSQIMDNLIAAGKTRPMLVVMDQGYALRPGAIEPPLRLAAAPANTGPGTPAPIPPEFLRRFSAFEDVLLQDVIPLVDSTCRTMADRDHRAIAGFSMGGVQAFLIGLRHLDTFASIGGLSGGGGGFGNGAIDPKTYLDGVFADPAAFNAKMRLIFLGIGTMEPARILNGVRGYHDALATAGIKHVFYESPGTSHEWLTERRNLRELSSLLFR